MTPTSAGRIRDLREGQIAKAFRWFMVVAALIPAYNNLRHGIGFTLLVALVQLGVYQLIATVIIWIPKFIAYAMRPRQ